MSQWSWYQRILLHKYASASKTMEKYLHWFGDANGIMASSFYMFCLHSFQKGERYYWKYSVFLWVARSCQKGEGLGLNEDDKPSEWQHWLKSHGDEQELDADAEIFDGIYSEEGLAALLALQVPLHEKLCGCYAVECAKHLLEIFQNGMSILSLLLLWLLPEMIWFISLGGRNSW